MISLFNKFTTFFRKLFHKNHKQLDDNSKVNKQNELSESIKQKENIIAEKESKLNEGISKLRKYRDWILSLKNEFVKEKILMEEKIDIAKKEAARADILSKEYKLEIQSLTEKNEQIQKELNKQKEINQQIKEAKSILEQTHINDAIENEALKNFIKDLHTKDSQKGSQDSDNNVDIPVSELNPATEEVQEPEIDLEQAKSQKNISANNGETDLIVEELLNEPDLDQPPSSEIEAPKKESYTIELVNRIGRKRITESEELILKGSIDDKVKRYKPKIVCWKDEWIWEIGVELPDELIDSTDVTVSQNDVPLIQDERRGNCFKLKLISSRIQIDSPDNNISDLDLANEGYLVFKLNAGNPNEGILVKHTSKGNYLVLVPNDWQFNENISGPQIADAEQTSLKDFSAYHFHLKADSTQKVGFINFNNESIIVESLRKFYSLRGNLIEDCSSKQGPLFGEKLPTLEIIDIDQWSEIDCIIIGEEGEDRKNWRKKILTSQDRVSIELADHLPHIISGWYFIRFYDSDLQLVDSCDFRFISALLKIEYNNLNLIPGEVGHIDAEIELTHNTDFNLISGNSSLDEITVTTLTPEKTRILVKPDPETDKLKFDVTSKNGRNVNLFIPIERIWWSVNQGESPGVWQDKIINLMPDDFLTLNKSIFIRFPSTGWDSLMKFGFQNGELRAYQIRSNLNFVRIPLSDYSDSENEMTLPGNHVLFCEITRNSIPIKFTPFNVVVNAKCKFCSQFESPDINIIANHIIEKHFDSIYVEPLYDDIQPLLPHLPRRIYQCIFCPKDHPTYIESFSHNPVEEIIRHIETEHPGERSAFRVLNDLEEIKKIISAEIPSYKKCKICKTPIPESDWTSHLLIRMHEKDITL